MDRSALRQVSSEQKSIPCPSFIHSFIPLIAPSIHLNIALTGWTISGEVMSPVKYELDFICQKTPFFLITAVKTSNLT
jgi:hypothetical protein